MGAADPYQGAARKAPEEVSARPVAHVYSVFAACLQHVYSVFSVCIVYSVLLEPNQSLPRFRTSAPSFRSRSFSYCFTSAAAKKSFFPRYVAPDFLCASNSSRI